MLDITAKSRTLIIIRKCNKRIFLFLRTSLTRPFLFQCEFWNIEWKIGNYRLHISSRTLFLFRLLKGSFKIGAFFKKHVSFFIILYGGYICLYEINVGSECLVHSCLMLLAALLKQNWISIAYVVIAITSMTDLFFTLSYFFNLLFYYSKE